MYIELVVDYSTGAARPGSVRFRPGTDQAATAFEAKVVCDPTGRLVVRQLDAKHQVKVVATARWRGTAGERITAIGGPNQHQWGVIESVLRDQLAAAAGAEFDAAARADGDIAPADLPVRPPGLLQRIGLGIIGVIVLVVIGAGIAVWMYVQNKYGPKKANGESCGYDSQCGSKNCFHSTCQAPGYGHGNLADGSKCWASDECASHDCSFGVCTQ